MSELIKEVMMNKKNLLRKIGGFILAALLVPGIILAASGAAQAQGRVIIVRPIVRPYSGWGWYGFHHRYFYPYGWNSYYNQYVFSNSERAASQGYHDGLKTGSDDGRKGKSYNPERSHYFHDAGFGNFAEAYRDGFLDGYRDGYRRA